MIQKFKNKPVEIEAIQYTGKNDFEIGKWSNDLVYPSPVLEPTENNPSGSYLQIKTLEGVMTAIVGDWIIKGVKGEFYPCKNDIFLMTYDVVIPKDVQNAQKFLQVCGRDMGFMGSPEYSIQKKIVDAYFEPIRQKEKEDLERSEYLKLKSLHQDLKGFQEMGFLTPDAKSGLGIAIEQVERLVAWRQLGIWLAKCIN